MNGRLHCNGVAYEGAVYSNENAGVVQDEHDIVDGFCTYCGMFDENYLTPNAEGFYEIATAKQLVWFEQLVNRGKLDANAGDDVTFDQVLAVGGDKLTIGSPLVESASVTGKVQDQVKGKKVIVYHYKRKTGYHKKNGHRQAYTKVQIEKINA